MRREKHLSEVDEWWRQHGGSDIRVRGVFGGYAAAVFSHGRKRDGTTVLGTYPTSDAAFEAAKTVIDTISVPRINTPADIERHRRHMAVGRARQRVLGRAATS